nr:putative reverse transcriptase domain-containing protein [Tanacetum cinerariifolium]
LVMSDSEDSAVTYTSVYTDSEPGSVFWGTDEEAHDPDFVPEPVYPEYIPLEDEHVLPAEEQPLPPVDSPTTESPGYVAESDPEEDPEYEDNEEQDGPVDYPMGKGDDGGDDDGDSSRDDAADEDEDMEEEEEDQEEKEEEEHIASTDSTAVIPVVELVSLPEGTKPVLPPPSIDITTTGARISALRITSTQALTDAVTAALPSSSLERMDEIPESERPPCKRSCLFAIGSRDTWIDPAEAVPALTPTIVEEVNTRVVELAEIHEHDLHDFHTLLEDAQDGRQIMVRTRRGQTPPPTNPNNMTPEAVQTMIDQALLRNSGGGYGSHGSHTENPRNMHTTRPCYYADFMKCHPLNFKGIEGAIRTLGPDAYTMTWSVLKKKITDKYCPLGEVKKLEIELWNLKVRDNNIPAYTNRFQELALIYTKFVSNETEKVDKYISGLLDNIYGNVKSSKPKTLDETVELANDLMDQKLHTMPAIAGALATPMLLIIEAAMGQTQGNGCFECGNLRHFKRDCPKLNNKNGGNGNAQGWVYVVGNAERNGNAAGNLDSNVVTGTFLLNNRYASILFDTGADRSFVSTAFSSLIDIITTPLDNHYNVELADEKIVGINTIIRGCTLNFLNHPFTIDIMPVELGSFDAIIVMDWLRRHHAVIVCDDKLVQIPFGNETLVFRGAESYIKRESRLMVISCYKVQEYMAKGCH